MADTAQDQPPTAPDGFLAAFLAGTMRLADPAAAAITRLTGGVSSDILRVEAAGRVFAVKRALPRLRVAQDWRVSTVRNAHEVAWLQLAGSVVPGAAPRVLGHDPAAGLFAMQYLDPATHPVWKSELRQGRTDPAFAARVGLVLASIHAATALDPAIAGRFAHQALFHAIRVEPYLGAAARAHPDLAGPLGAIASGLLAARIALVHGDISPKNILAGPRGPVLLDAECACYGDPAFDLAFCLTHLLLKCLWVAPARSRLLACFDALRGAYHDAVRWEPADRLASRACAIVPALMLARIDGASPVEYLADPADAALVRGFARRHLATAAPDLGALRSAWAAACAGARG